MGLNRIQIHIFKQLSSALGMKIEDYLSRFSKEYILRDIKTLDDLTEEEGDSWITKAYLESLG
ncbi:hypothetical protein [Desulforhopalus sp. IMCC35007]|uniref:hypothetical protein n=1 Tax=Desulforhopalus sp. IMCC35007 TaxID=2569543 RepID=UPI0010AEAB46|nr:hypothetical protein [Desulforhopalus sp. IMCC35007]TKB09608.1 hypothetical protein FCL48_09155 [Desulforhopalus sp. IMCC35007]